VKRRMAMKRRCRRSRPSRCRLNRWMGCAFWFLLESAEPIEQERLLNQFDRWERRLRRKADSPDSYVT